MSRYRFIEVEKVNHAVRTLCRVLQVSRAAYYHWSIHLFSAHASADLVLSERITAIHARSRQTYGAPREPPLKRHSPMLAWPKAASLLGLALGVQGTRAASRNSKVKPAKGYP